ncbi:MAG: hypothetical protein ACJ76D_05205 [Solirubrobacterales bacterium]
MSAVAIFAAAAAGSASATVLCKSAPATHVCPGSDRYGANISTGFELSSPFKITIGQNPQTTLESCNEGGIIAGNPAGNWTNAIAYGFNSCTRTLSPGGAALELNWTAGTHSGLVSFEAFVEVNTIFGKCGFTLEGPGEWQAGLPDARLVFVNARAIREYGLCPAEAQWSAIYDVSSPSPAYVEKE